MAVKNSDRGIKEIGDEMKRLEAGLETRLPADGYVIIRVDGRAFHTLTRGMEKPFDPLFVKAMDAAAVATLKALDAAFVYVQSDEITAVLSPYGRKADSLPFDGRLEKLVTIASSAAASGFTRMFALRALAMEPGRVAPVKMSDGNWSLALAMEAGQVDNYDNPSGQFRLPTVSFDARAIHVDDLTGVADNLLWRRVDCRKNAVTAAAQAEFTDSELHGKSTMERWQMLADKHGGDLQIDEGLYWGRLLFKKPVTTDDGQGGEVERRELTALPATRENAGMVLSLLESDVAGKLGARDGLRSAAN